MTEQEKIEKITNKITEYTSPTVHNQGLISYNDIPKLAGELVKIITHEPALSSVHTKWDCDDCKHYPCTHQDIVGNNKKLKYNQCGDHSERGAS